MSIIKEIYINFCILTNLFSFRSLHGIHLHISNLSRIMQFYIYSGDYESEDRKLCKQYLDKTDRVLELGSSIGFISLYCIKKIGIQNFFCVEPNPEAIEELKINFRKNNAQLKYLAAGLARKDSEVELFTNDNLWACNILNDKLLERPKSIKIKGKTLQSIIAEVPFKPNVIILDIEGAEKFLKREDFTPGIKKIIIELHPAIIGSTTAHQVLSELKDAGFEVIDQKNDCFFLKRI